MSVQIRPLHYFQAWDAPRNCFKPMYKAGWYYTHDKCWAVRRTTENTWMLGPTQVGTQEYPQLSRALEKYVMDEYYPTRKDAIEVLETFLSTEGIEWS